MKVSYVGGRASATSAVDAVFKEASGIALKNVWRPMESASQLVGESDVPAQNFSVSMVTKAVRDALQAEIIEIPGSGACSLADPGTTRHRGNALCRILDLAR